MFNIIHSYKNNGKEKKKTKSVYERLCLTQSNTLTFLFQNNNVHGYIHIQIHTYLLVTNIIKFETSSLNTTITCTNTKLPM